MRNDLLFVIIWVIVSILNGIFFKELLSIKKSEPFRFIMTSLASPLLMVVGFIYITVGCLFRLRIINDKKLFFIKKEISSYDELYRLTLCRIKNDKILCTYSMVYRKINLYMKTDSEMEGEGSEIHEFLPLKELNTTFKSIKGINKFQL